MLVSKNDHGNVCIYIYRRTRDDCYTLNLAFVSILNLLWFRCMSHTNAKTKNMLPYVKVDTFGIFSMLLNNRAPKRQVYKLKSTAATPSQRWMKRKMGRGIQFRMFPNVICTTHKPNVFKP